MATNKTVYLTKLIGGGLSLFLQDVTGDKPDRWFRLSDNSPRLGVPINYALSLFQNSAVEQLFNTNHFMIEDYEGFYKVAVEEGFAPEIETAKEAEPAPLKDVRSPAIIKAIIRGANQEAIRKLFASPDRDRAREIAIAEVNDLSRATIGLIEEILGMAIENDIAK